MAAALIDSLETADEAVVSDAWRKGLIRRRDALRAGSAVAQPWTEVRARISAL